MLKRLVIDKTVDLGSFEVIASSLLLSSYSLLFILGSSLFGFTGIVSAEAVVLSRGNRPKVSPNGSTTTT